MKYLILFFLSMHAHAGDRYLCQDKQNKNISYEMILKNNQGDYLFNAYDKSQNSNSCRSRWGCEPVKIHSEILQSIDVQGALLLESKKTGTSIDMEHFDSVSYLIFARNKLGTITKYKGTMICQDPVRETRPSCPAEAPCWSPDYPVCRTARGGSCSP